MIAHLAGKLLQKQPNSIIIDVAGVGYEVTIPLSTFYGLDEVGGGVALRIHTHVREDNIQLFGFATAREKELFLRLTSVSGIGPKLAITMLSGMPATELFQAIRNNDLARLTAIPGVGRKTAERVVVELRDKLAALVLEPGEAESALAAAANVSSESDVRDDTIAALIQLGYPKAVAERAVTAALREEGEQSIEAVLKRSLKRISR
ncbi:MAG TPA: Holliday junction branch migration protein RuvA [Blastocatellia bacterium]|nr:Holliday junction branch migration protein RuvA [Blastocatellia bacterium]